MLMQSIIAITLVQDEYATDALALYISFFEVISSIRCVSAIWKFQMGTTQSVPQIDSAGVHNN